MDVTGEEKEAGQAQSSPPATEHTTAAPAAEAQVQAQAQAQTLTQSSAGQKGSKSVALQV